MCLSSMSISGYLFRVHKVKEKLYFEIVEILFRYLNTDDTCPMCASKIDPSSMVRLDSGAAVDSFLAQSADMS